MIIDENLTYPWKLAVENYSKISQWSI